MNWQVSTYNCRGLRDKCKRQKVFKWLRDKNQDVYFLQETHSSACDEVKWQSEWGVELFALMEQKIPRE